MITLTEAKQFLGIETSVTEFDTLLNAFILEVTDMINNYIGYDISQQTIEYCFRGNNTTDIYLPFINVTEVTGLEYRINPTSDYVSMDYELYVINGESYLYADSFFYNYFYKADIVTGYSTIPNIVKLKAKELVSYLFRESGASQGRLRNLYGVESISETVNGITTNTKFAPIFNDIAKYLDKYKRVLC